MIYLTFYHGRNIFRGGNLASWISANFPSAKFEGFEYGHYLPMISIPLQEFEAGKTNIPAKNLIKIEGRFDLFTQLVYGVRNFKNECSEKEQDANAEFESVV